MTDTTDRSLLAHLFVVAMVGVLVLSPVASVFGPVGTASASDGIHYVTDSGFEIEDTSGGSARPTFSDDNTLDLPGITLSSSGSAFVTLEQRQGSFTNLSSITDSPAVTVTPDDKQTVALSGGFDSLRFREPNYSVANIDADLVYSASSEARLRVDSTGLQTGDTLVAVDVDSDTILDTASVTSNGSITFSALDSGSHTVNLRKPDTGTPSISSFEGTNPSGQTVAVRFDSDELLSTITVSLSGSEDATLSTSAFTETANADGTYTYKATYAASTDGSYIASLDTAADSGNNDGASDQSSLFKVDSVAPTVSSFTAWSPSPSIIKTRFDADEPVDDIIVDFSGPESASITEFSFSETDHGNGTYTYTGTYSSAKNGTYTAQLKEVNDLRGNTAITGQTDNAVVSNQSDDNNGSTGDTTAPSVSNVTLGESSGNMTVSFDTDEQLGTNTGAIAASVTGPAGKTYTFDRTHFTESGSGPYTYSLSTTQAYDDGNGTYSLSIDDALDAAGNNGGNGGTGTSLTDSHNLSSGDDNAVYDPGDPAAGYDKNTDGRIQIGELGDAAADYAQGTISIGALGDVAADYAQSGSTTTARHESSRSQDDEPRDLRSIHDRWGSIVIV